MSRDDPEYNTHAVSERTGVPTSTFFAWERRFGIPRPHRTARNQRLYSEHDIAQIEWLRDRTQEGMTISQAMAQLRSRLDAQEQQIRAAAESSLRADIVVSMAADRTITSSPARLSTPPEQLQAVTDVIEALLRCDDRAASDALDALAAMGSTTLLTTGIIPEILSSIAQSVISGDTSPAVERLAHQMLARRLGALLDVINPPAPIPQAIVAGVGAETSQVDVLLLAVNQARQGCRVLELGTDIPLPDLVAIVSAVNPATVALAASTPAAARMLRVYQDHLLLRFEERSRPALVYAGTAFATVPGLSREMLGDPGEWARRSPFISQDDAGATTAGINDG
ncbi:MAG: MerR family transcriptional regulator [Thermomicrobiales bacterium]